MVLLTKVLRPGAPRIGQLTENFVLPRTIPVFDLVAGIAGGLFGLLFGLLLGVIVGAVNVLAVMVSLILGAVLGVGLVRWKPWQGESVATVLRVSRQARRNANKLTCPGSGEAPNYDPDFGGTVCAVCRVLVDTEEGMALVHDWKRQFYVGMMPVSAPITGAVHFRPGSRLVERSQTNR